MTRREFLKQAGVAVAVSVAAMNGSGKQIRIGASGSVALFVDPTDAVANSSPVQWAINQLQDSLAERQVQVRRVNRIADGSTVTHLLVATSNQKLAHQFLPRAPLRLPEWPESLALLSGKVSRQKCSVIYGYDPRGLTYGLLELADRVRYAEDPLEALMIRQPVVERPANQIRSNMRLFASDVEDKSWFYDRDFWRRYLSMLAAQRFNRFSLALGLGYDFPSGIRDAYFHFAYPFLVTVPGYEVQVSGVSGAEREQNLGMMRFISEETAARGLHFQLGVWTHAYQWIDSPLANHTITGLTAQTHASYCRDALRRLLMECPAIGGVTFRVHGESGVAEGSYDFWKTVFQGLTQCGRPLQLDMHAKGMDAEMIDVALATNLPVTISPKFWAEHMGLPYHQAGIRPTEKPRRDRKDDGFFSRSSGSRSFLRYGYGDLLAEGRRYNVLHRIWPGTQRLLLWGDPVMAAAYSRASSFCGSNGVELFEPLSFKGRKGSGLPGGRDGYADASLKSSNGDYQKYSYSYRLWGRLLYNPDTEPEVWRRLLLNQYGPAANHLETALSNASRILPLITTAHTPSAANNNYWPEIYTNMPIVDPRRKHPYGDTPSPKRFGTVSPLDPQLFSPIDEFADELVQGKLSPRYSPVEVGDWLLTLAASADRGVGKAEKLVSTPQASPFRRLFVDVAIEAGLARFFARKLRAGVLFALHQRTGAREFLLQASAQYRLARQAWAQLAERATGVYRSDLTFGLEPQLRGHWQDRLSAIDLDIADMEKRLDPALAPPTSTQMPLNQTPDRILRALNNKSQRPAISVKHMPASGFQRGQRLSITLFVSTRSGGPRSLSVRLFYRHTNQAEEFQDVEMATHGGALRAEIPAQYTDSVFPMQYYFAFRDHEGRAWTHPGLGPDLNHQPYYVLRQV